MANKGYLQAVSWQASYQGQPSHTAWCEGEVLIIDQDEDLQVADTVPRRICELIDDDKKQLERLNIPTNSWYDDAGIIAARFALDKRYTMVRIERSKPKSKLSKVRVLQLIRDAMKTSIKPKGIVSVTHALVLWYTCLLACSCTQHAQCSFAILDLGRRTLVIGVLKMDLSHSGKLSNATSSTSKEDFW